MLLSNEHYCEYWWKVDIDEIFDEKFLCTNFIYFEVEILYIVDGII